MTSLWNTWWGNCGRGCKSHAFLSTTVPNFLAIGQTKSYVEDVELTVVDRMERIGVIREVTLSPLSIQCEGGFAAESEVISGPQYQAGARAVALGWCLMIIAVEGETPPPLRKKALPDQGYTSATATRLLTPSPLDGSLRLNISMAHPPSSIPSRRCELTLYPPENRPVKVSCRSSDSSLVERERDP